MSVQPLLVVTPRLMRLFASWTESIKWRETEEQEDAHAEAIHVEAHPEARDAEATIEAKGGHRMTYSRQGRAGSCA